VIRSLFSRARLLLYFVPLALLLVVPVLAIAQAVTAPASPQLDVVGLLNALPIPPALKVCLLFAFPIAYSAAACLRGFTSPASWTGRAVRIVLDGVRHPAEAPQLVPIASDSSSPDFSHTGP